MIVCRILTSLATAKNYWSGIKIMREFVSSIRPSMMTDGNVMPRTISLIIW